MSDAREDSGPSTEREGTTLARSFLLSLLGPPVVLVLVLTPGFIGLLREPPSGMDGMTFGGVLFLYALFASSIIIPVSVIGVPLAAVATWQTLRHRTWRWPARVAVAVGFYTVISLVVLLLYVLLFGTWWE